MTLINKALGECDLVIIGVCGYDDDRGKYYIPFRDRISLMKDKFKSNKNVIIAPVDDKKIGLTGKFDRESWEIWSKELFEQSHINPDNHIRWYMGEQSYADKLSEIFPKHEFYVVNRSPISGTKIRQGEYDDKIDIDFKNYLRGKEDV